MQGLVQIDPLDPGFWQAVAAAAIAGGAIGLERESRNKPFGMRTGILICVGTVTFIKLGIWHGGGGATDATRVLGQIVTGIGFLGAGSIMVRGGTVQGLTSATTIWMLAAIGAMLGFGHLRAGLLLTALTLTVLLGIDLLSRAIRRTLGRPDTPDGVDD